MLNDPARRWTAALIAITFVWGATFVVVKEAVDRLPVSTFNGWRFALATLVLGVMVRRRFALLGARGLLHGVLLGTALGLGYALQTFGLRHTTASKAGFITGMFVVFTPLLHAAINRRRPDLAAILGAGLAAVGLGLLSLRGSLLPSSGDLLVLGGAVAFAFHIVGLGRWSARYPAGPLAAVQLGVVGAGHLLAGAIADLAGSDTIWLPRGAYLWGALLLTAVFASALAFTVQTAAQAVLEPTRAAVIMTMEPVFGWLMAWLGTPVLLALGMTGLQREAFGVREAAGAATILAGMLWTELRGAAPPGAVGANETGTLSRR